MLALLMLAQVVVGPPSDDATPAVPAEAPACKAANGDEIMVCATDPEAHRLRALPAPAPASKPVTATVTKRLSAGTTVAAGAETTGTKEGVFVRAMAHLNIAF